MYVYLQVILKIFCDSIQVTEPGPCALRPAGATPSPFPVFCFFFIIPSFDLSERNVRTVKLQSAAHWSSCEQGLPQGVVHTHWTPLYCWAQDSEPSKDRWFF